MKKNKNEVVEPQRKQVRTKYAIINATGTVPIARPASNIQLTPVVQPIAMIPYSTQSQPILVDDEDY